MYIYIYNYIYTLYREIFQSLGYCLWCQGRVAARNSLPWVLSGILKVSRSNQSYQSFCWPHLDLMSSPFSTLTKFQIKRLGVVKPPVSKENLWRFWLSLKSELKWQWCVWSFVFYPWSESRLLLRTRGSTRSPNFKDCHGNEGGWSCQDFRSWKRLF